MASDTLVRRLAECVFDRSLRNRGFTLDDHGAHRRRGLGVDVIDFQASKFGKGDATQVVVNIGLFHPEVFRAVWGKEAPSAPRIEEAVVTRRLPGPEAESIERGEHWFDLRAPIDVEVVAAEVVVVIERFGLPFLDRINTVTEIVDLLKAKRSKTVLDRIHLGVLTVNVGEREEGLAILRQVGRDAKGWEERVTSVIGRL